MDNILLILKENSVSVSFLIFAVMLGRILLKRTPKSVRCVLWLLVGVRLVLPFQIESAFSLIPGSEEVKENIQVVQLIADYRTEDNLRAVSDTADNRSYYAGVRYF